MCDLIQSRQQKNVMCQFEDICLKINGMRVPNQNGRYDVIKRIFAKSERLNFSELALESLTFILTTIMKTVSFIQITPIFHYFRCFR